MIFSRVTFSSSKPNFLLHDPRSISPIPCPCNLRFPNLNISPTNRESVTLRSSASETRTIGDPARPMKKKRQRHRKQYPGESKGITEEMRFVAMRLRNVNGKKCNDSGEEGSDEESHPPSSGDSDAGVNGEANPWQPSMQGFITYLVDSKLVFNTIERIVDKSEDVAYAYFRRTGLERSEGLSMDIEWFRQQNYSIPEPRNQGVAYAKYLEELAQESAPLFLTHFYTIYFSQIAGGQVIARKVSVKLLDKRELEFYKWEGDEQESLKGVREKLNLLGEHWSRDERNKCLRETAKSFKYLGQIVRLIILSA